MALAAISSGMRSSNAVVHEGPKWTTVTGCSVVWWLLATCAVRGRAWREPWSSTPRTTGPVEAPVTLHRHDDDWLLAVGQDGVSGAAEQVFHEAVAALTPDHEDLARPGGSDPAVGGGTELHLGGDVDQGESSPVQLSQLVDLGAHRVEVVLVQLRGVPVGDRAGEGVGAGRRGHGHHHQQPNRQVVPVGELTGPRGSTLGGWEPSTPTT